MGCGNAQEKLENQIMEMNIDKIEIQMERYKQMKLLGENSKNLNKTKDLNNNNNNNITSSNINVKRKTTPFKTTKQNEVVKNGKRRSKSVKTARIQSNISHPH